MRLRVSVLIVLVVLSRGLLSITDTASQGRAHLEPPYSVYLPVVQAPAPSIIHDRVVLVDPSGHSLLLNGEVTNPTPSCIFVQGLSAVFYDATGRVVGTGTVRSMLFENVLPGETVPFVIELNSVDGLDGIVTYDFLLSWVVCGGVTRFHTPTALSDYALNDPAKGFLIVATFRNDRAHPIKELRAVATLYDRQGDVLWVETWDPPPFYEVQSGETSTYEIPTYIDFGNAVARYRVMLRAVEQP